MSAPERLPWTRQEFERKLRAKGERYHIHHPFQVRMNSGHCTPGQVRGWIRNRFYYQLSIPLKDAAILSNCPDRAVRREWIKRIVDHDGTLDHFRTRDQQERALEILQFKLDVLWAMLDAMQIAYPFAGDERAA